MKLFKMKEKIKNQALLKRGSYSLAITAIVLAGLILLNVFVRIVDARFPLEYDMTAQKVNTISEENIDFIKNVEVPVEVIVCANKDLYAENLLLTLNNANVSIVNNTVVYDYCEQTINLVEKYHSYNDKITVRFVDPESSDFIAVKSLYSDYMSKSFVYGDILVIGRHEGGNDRVKYLSFAEIYQFELDENLSYYGSFYNVMGNRIESALTSAINNATITEIKKVGIIKGHSSSDYSASVKTLLNKNGFEVSEITSATLTQIPEDVDVIAIIAPTTDFVEAELDIISAFLNNNGLLGKSLLYFGSSVTGYLPNLADFLETWGIKSQEGVLFETNANYFFPGDPLTMQFGAVSGSENAVEKAASICVTGNNMPLTPAFETEGSIKVTPLYATSGETIAAPKGTTAEWKSTDGYEKTTYYGVIESEKVLYVNNERVANYVYAFSSIDFVEPQTANAGYYTSNDEAIVLAATKSAAGIKDTTINFSSKVITENVFDEAATEGESNAVRTIFMFVIPIALLVAAVIVYIRRRNA